MNDLYRGNGKSVPEGTTGRTVNTRELNEIIRSDGNNDRPSRDIPDHIAKHYVAHNNAGAYASAHKEGKVEFVDRGNRMHAYHPISAFTARSLVQIAETRGWESFTITGSDKFKQSAYVEAASRGIDVHGYKPTDEDLRKVERSANIRKAGSNPAVQAFDATNLKTEDAAAEIRKSFQAEMEKAIAAKNKSLRTSAVKAHPELAAAFKVMDEARKVAAGIDGYKGQEAYLGQIRDSVKIDLDLGRLQAPKTAKLATAETVAPEAQSTAKSRSRSR